MLEFNVNECVYVKLTDYGRNLHFQKFSELSSRLQHAIAYTPPQEDENGWSRWQLHNLMAEFGEHLFAGCTLPFETVIRIPEDKDAPH